MSRLALRGVRMDYRTRKSVLSALEESNLDIAEAQFACIVGPSGCGKSTILNIFAGLIRPTAGTAYIDEDPIRGPGAERGMVSQGYTLFPWLRVRENVEFGPSLRGVARRQRRETAEALLAELGLGDFADAYPRELSGGMQQRVAIARALANDPKVMLMDEPFGALDALSRVSAQRFLTSVWEEHRRTIVFITHDIEEAVFLGDVVHVMSPRPGRIRASIPVDIERPRDLRDMESARFAQLRNGILEMIFEDEAPVAGTAAAAQRGG